MSEAAQAAAGGASEEIALHAALYLAAGIQDAIEVFADFARFEVRRQGPWHLVQVHDIDPEVDGDLLGEFCNFALVHSIERQRGTPGAAEVRA